VDTSLGAVGVTWGINRWVLVDTPSGSLQRQVAKRAAQRGWLVDAGLARDEAEELAATLWKRRPADAGIESASRDEAPWYATGLPTWAIFAILLAVVALYVVYLLRSRL